MNYSKMQKFYLDGKISEQNWLDFCFNYFNFVVLADPAVIAVLKRLKYK